MAQMCGNTLGVSGLGPNPVMFSLIFVFLNFFSATAFGPQVLSLRVCTFPVHFLRQ